MGKKRSDTSPLRVGGDDMIKLLRGVRLDTLEQIAEDLKPITFANVDLIRAVETVMENRQMSMLEEGDTVTMDLEDA